MNSCTNDPEMDCDGCDKVMVVYSNEGVGCVFKEDSKVKTMMNESEEIKALIQQSIVRAIQTSGLSSDTEKLFDEAHDNFSVSIDITGNILRMKAEWGKPNIPYFYIHLFGGTIRPKKSGHLHWIDDSGRHISANQVVIPRRTFIRLDEICMIDIHELIFNIITDNFATEIERYDAQQSAIDAKTWLSGQWVEIVKKRTSRKELFLNSIKRIKHEKLQEIFTELNLSYPNYRATPFRIRSVARHRGLSEYSARFLQVQLEKMNISHQDALGMVRYTPKNELLLFERSISTFTTGKL